MLCKSLLNECTTGMVEPKVSFLGVHSVQLHVAPRVEGASARFAITVFKPFTSEQKTPHFHFTLEPQNYGVWSWLSFSAKTADVFFLREEGDTDHGRGWMACT